MGDSHIEKLFLATDYKKRTVMRIITMNGYDKLFEGESIDLLLHEIWQGEGMR